MKILTCFCFSLFWSLTCAQEIQNKIFIIDENFYIPRAENKIASFCFGSINSAFSETADCRELPVGLLSISNNAVKYSIRDGKVISASFLDSRNKYWGGPAIIAIEPDKMKSLNDRQVKQFIEDYGFTYHDILDQTILDGGPLREAVFKNNLQELIFDFTVTKEGDIFCFLIIMLGVDGKGSILQTWKLLDSGKELIICAEQPKDTDWSKLKTEPMLIANYPLPEKMEEMTTFSLGKQVFLFNPISGNFYRFTEYGLQPISVDLDDKKPYKDFTLVVDKDNQAIFLLPKSALKRERKTFREVVDLYGVRIPILR